MNVMYQANVQQNFQRNDITTHPTLNVTTRDPRVTSLVEQAAEAYHREAMGRAESSARHLQDALVGREQKEMSITRELMGQDTAELSGRLLWKLSKKC